MNSGRFFSLLLLISSACSITAHGQVTSMALDSGWEFRQRVDENALAPNGAPEVPPSTNPALWRPAQVPGVVDTDLLRNKLIPDPFYRENEAKLQWIENADWVYRATLQVTPEMLRHRHIELVFDGLDGYAEVSLNGAPVLTADNAFRQWRFDAKPNLKAGGNELLVVFPSPISQARKIAADDPWRAQTGVEDKTYIRKAAYEYGWDWGPRFVNSGIWRPARLELWDNLRIADFHIAQPDVSRQVAHLAAEVEIVSAGEVQAKLTLQGDHGGKKFEQSENANLHQGRNTLRIPFSISNPDLWFPAGYGPQALYTLTLQVSSGGRIEDAATRRTGLRSVVLRRDKDQWGRSFEFVVNGIPVFAKGADVIPFDSFPTRVTEADYRRVLESAREANMNMIRHWGGGYYETDSFYSLCDELGIMVWQDFMFGNDWQPGEYSWKQNVQQEIDYQLRRLRDHPSVVLWCGNNETEEAFHWGTRDSLPANVRLRMEQDYLTVFSGIVPSIVERLEPEIPYWPSSPSADYEDQTSGYQTGDMHNWQIWHGMEPIRDYEKYFPRFMSEFGFQSFPEMRTIEAFTLADDRRGITTPVMLAHQKNTAGNQKIHEYMLQEYGEPKDFASFLYVSQVLQAEAIKFGAEHLRRLRPRSMGSIYWQLNDCWPVASWSSIDYFGRWKALQFYARRFYAPVLVSPHEENGNVAVYVISDQTSPLTAELTVRLIDLNGRELRKQIQTITVAPLSSKIYFSAPRTEYVEAGGADPAQTFLLAELRAGSKLISSNLLYFVHAKNFELPPAHISSNLEASGNSYQLTLSSDKLARDVYISFGDLDAKVSDNYFDLLPGKSEAITITSNAPVEQLRNALSVVSLANAFPPGRVVPEKSPVMP
ncbi:MAG TPA: glycoside hydrolase family 2 protein [Terriglobales bacterium]|nr:glycoside hydrolase family 2 protein [Terriglobales bacterium]